MQRLIVAAGFFSRLSTCRGVSQAPFLSGLGELGGVIGRSGFEVAKRAAVDQRWEHSLPVETYLEAAGLLNRQGSGSESSPSPVLLDVRAPCEYAKGHIPGAISLPLFSDAERAEVGTLYKREGHDVAVKRGLKLVDRKWPSLLEAVPQLSEGDDVLVYCFRGGMRSGGMAWLLSQAPLRVRTLAGGYKSYRNWALRQWEEDRPLVVLGGKTGSGKTDVLLAMRDELGAQVLDLEGEANHRGSIFGSLGRPPQPTNEHYENHLALQWAKFSADCPVFIEDESHAVGSCGVPPGLWGRMRSAEVTSILMEVPHAARIDRLVGEYGVYPPERLAACVEGLKKRLGGERVGELVEALERSPPALELVADQLLEHYYDGMYTHQAKSRGGHKTTVTCDSGDALMNAQLVLERSAELLGMPSTP